MEGPLTLAVIDMCAQMATGMSYLDSWSIAELHPPWPGNTEHSGCPTAKNVELPDLAFDIKKPL